MKKIIFIAAGLFLIGCGSDDKDCNCTQQRWERKATYTVINGTTNPPTGGNLVSATEWEKAGSSESAGDDCSKNGSVSKSGSGYLSSNSSTYTNLEYEYRVTCN